MLGMEQIHHIYIDRERYSMRDSSSVKNSIQRETMPVLFKTKLASQYHGRC